MGGVGGERGYCMLWPIHASWRQVTIEGRTKRDIVRYCLNYIQNERACPPPLPPCQWARRQCCEQTCCRVYGALAAA